MDELLRCSRILQDLLSEVADDLEKHTGNVKIAKGVGTAAAVVGTGTGIAGLIVGTVLSAGTAAPVTVPAIAGLAVGFSGVGVGAAGTLTSAGASLVGKLIEKSKLKEFEDKWQDFKLRLRDVSLDKFYDDVSISNLKCIISRGCIVDLTSIQYISRNKEKLIIPIRAVTTSAFVHAAFLPNLTMVELLGLMLERKGSCPVEHVRSFANIELQQIIDVCEN